MKKIYKLPHILQVRKVLLFLLILVESFLHNSH